ncbi:hypothetical protein ABNQ39_36790 (plasmid) [Azospirillum sp. A26]|uniref:hypothetical protein n=1 Tax=Azospirillum sp. A26 TaxID=3160607 RepID=UPI00366E286C
MTHALNLTLPIKQDPETLAKLANLEKIFATKIQKDIEDALRKSGLVHFARILVIDNLYIQVITEYEGDHQEYTEFFRKELTNVFREIFSLVDSPVDVSDPAAFWNFSRDRNIRSLGMTTGNSTTMDGKPAGWLFSAYNHKSVKEIQGAIQDHP